MTTLFTALAAIASVTLTAIGLFRADDRLRHSIKTDSEVLNALPEGPARQRLQAHIEERVTRLIDYETRRRDWGAIIFGIVGVPLFTGVAVELIDHGTWWSVTIGVVAALLALGGVFIAFEGSSKTHRNEKGIRIPVERG